jgi:AcrR family transcriptional regulator
MRPGVRRYARLPADGRRLSPLGRAVRATAEAVGKQAKRTSTRQRNPRGEGARLRDEIIDAATVLLEQTGSEDAISMRAIAREVGIASPSMARHFSDVTDVIDAVVAKELAGFRSLLVAAGEAATDPVDHLYALCRTYLAFGREHPARYRVLVGRRFVQDWDRRAVTMEQTAPLMADTIRLVVDAIQLCIDAGASSSADASFDALILWFSMHGLVTVPAAIPSIAWPSDDALLRDSVARAARLV